MLKTRVLALSLTFLGGVALAQTLPNVPKDPVAFLMRTLQTEANFNIVGAVLERQQFPPRKEPEVMRKDLSAPPPIALPLVQQNFRANISVGEAIAGRDTWRVDFEPVNKDAPRFAYWIDREYSVRLGIEERDSSGQVTFEARYTNVALPGVARAKPRQLNQIKFKPKLEAFVKKNVGDLALPQGFRLFEIRPRSVGKDALPALELRATNGLSVLVIVFAPIGAGSGPKVVSKNIAGTFVWVIGNFPKSDLERVSHSVKQSLNLGNLLSNFEQLR
jgi:hypothetical protein